MLTKLDDWPRHQIASTFDRYRFCAYDPSGSVALVTGIGVYNNMNVLDAQACPRRHVEAYRSRGGP